MQGHTLSITPSSTDSPAPRPIRAAATLVVLRDGAQGLEVLLLRRAEKANDQNSGASVFPGGVLDAHDRALHRLCGGMDDAAASDRLSLAEGGLDYYAAAIRECFEEAGVLFAEDAEGRPAELTHLPPEELAALRAAADQGTDALVAMCEARGWVLAADRLAYFSHWLTPPGMPRRFDTRFFIAAMPLAQVVQADGRETVEHQWLRPHDALEPSRGLKFMNVTRRILEQLGAFGRVDECLAHARALREIVLNMPRLARGLQGQRAVNIDDPAYAEVGYLDPEGRGTAHSALEAGLTTQLFPQVLRVTDGTDGVSTAPGSNSYFIGTAGDECLLIDPMPPASPHFGALREAAPGPVRWLLSTRGDIDAQRVAALRATWPEASAVRLAAGEVLAAGGVSIRAVQAADGTAARDYLLVEERLLFTGSAPAGGMGIGAPEDADWLAPREGFLQRNARASQRGTAAT